MWSFVLCICVSDKQSKTLLCLIQTHTHTRLTALFPWLPGWAGTRKVTPIWILLFKSRDSEWQWHQLGYVQVCTSLHTGNHANTPPLSFFTGRMHFLPPNQQHQSTVFDTECVDIVWLLSVTWNCLRVFSIVRNLLQSLSVSLRWYNYWQVMPSVLWHCWLGIRKSIRPVKLSDEV